MKRVHRRWQQGLWWLLAPALAALLFTALSGRSSVPANAELPTALLTNSTPRSP